MFDVWGRFTIDLNLSIRVRFPTTRLRTVRFTMVLKQSSPDIDAKPCLRAVRFTRVLKPTNAPTELPGCLRAVRFTLGGL